MLNARDLAMQPCCRKRVNGIMASAAQAELLAVLSLPELRIITAFLHFQPETHTHTLHPCTIRRPHVALP